ncbi:MAG TPA: response regulator [Gammaproteobacteria bacterium]|jgi:CheY-like chemotaxis protein|nr:response regulator [Gammaproteobacteria bacterium]
MNTSNTVKTNKYSVLLVEDELLVQKIHYRFLEILDCAIVVAMDGEEALKKAKEESFDLIFMDVGLPLIGGVEVITMIRENEQINKINPVPIIVLTAYKEEKVFQDCLKAGANAVHLKPLNFEGFTDLINQYCK